MPAIEPFYRLLGRGSFVRSREMALIIEAEVLLKVYTELLNTYGGLFSGINFHKDKENEMIDEKFLRLIINDLVLSEAYTIEGIAHHIQEPEDVIFELAAGKNTDPSLRLSRKMIELHRTVRSDYYQKVIMEFLLANKDLILKSQCL